MVRLDDFVLGDLGNARVDSRLLYAILRRDHKLADWLRSRGITEEDPATEFPDAAWC